MPTEQQTTELDDSLRVIALEVADDLAELARVRAWADRLLQDLPRDQRVDALMVVDELTSNALRHGKPPRQVRLLRKRDWLSVEVDDTCVDPACPPAALGQRRPRAQTGQDHERVLGSVATSDREDRVGRDRPHPHRRLNHRATHPPPSGV